MAETIRIEIPIETIDNTDPALSNATKKLDKFSDSADKAGKSVDKTRDYVSKFDLQADKTLKSLAKWAKEKYEIALEAKEKISPVLQSLGGSLRSLTGKTWSFTLKAMDLATAPVRAVLNLLKNPLLQAGAFFGVSFGLTDTINTQKDFEAAMAQVQAVSGATGSELAELTQKAEEMGAATKFTAAESAEAFNYMAMAGWKTEDMLNGIEGILNLAAASNEDLGTTSDIVTDALTAFGLQASDAGEFSDVLAAASSNANTNVSMMGETFKYAASMAGSLGYSIQDVALMTGLMANSGIKASMAGTALNTIFTRLSTNTGNALDTLRSLGIEFYDSNGNARALADVMGELRDATAGMNDEQRSNIANTIAGTGAQKGLLAILNASEADYQSLAKAIDNADGASKRMANTQLDNLSGSITLLQSAVDGVKISFGKRLNPYVRSVADELTAAMPDIEAAITEFMDFVDRKYEVVQQRIDEMKTSEAWQNADFSGKVRIAWNEIIAEPFREWWSGTGKAMVADVAKDVGSGIGSAISAGLLMLLGVDVSDSVNDGASVGRAFASGFAEGFDIDAIKDGLLGSLGGIFSSAGKLLPGGQSADIGSIVSAAIIAKAVVPAISIGKDIAGIGKGIFGAQESLGGASLVGTLIGSAKAGTGLLGFGANTAIGLGAGDLSATASLGAGSLSMLGLGAVAGGAVGGASAVSGALDLYRAVRSTDTDYKDTYAASGATKLAGVASGAAAGAMLGSVIPGIGTVVGGLIGAGAGGIMGFVGSKKIKQEYEDNLAAATARAEKAQKVYELTGTSIENARFKTDDLAAALDDADVSAEQFGAMFRQAVSDDLIDHFGQLHLSLEEIRDAASMIVFNGMEDQFDNYTSQAKEAASSLTTFKSALNALDKANWKMSLGAGVTDADIKNYRSSIENMVSAATDYLEQKHYEANLALKLIMGSDADTSSLDSTYAVMASQINELSDRLSEEIEANITFEDGVLHFNETEEILSLQQQIAAITNQVAEAENTAKLDVIKIKYSGADLDAESFSSLQEELSSYTQQAQEQLESALSSSLANLNLELSQGAISQGEYDEQYKTYESAYNEQIQGLKLRVESVQLQAIADAYGEALDGILPDIEGTLSEKLQLAMSEALNVQPDAAQWTTDDVTSWFGLDSMDAETRTALAELLKAVAETAPESLKRMGSSVRNELESQIASATAAPIDATVVIDYTEQVRKKGSADSAYAAASGAFSTPSTTGGSGNAFVPASTYAAAAHANGGLVGRQELSWIGEEGPEMIIPLVPSRRDRAIELYEQVGAILGVTAHANGGLVGIAPGGSNAASTAISSESLNYLTQTVNAAPINSHALSSDPSRAIQSTTTQNTPAAQQTAAVQPNVTVSVNLNPAFNISGSANGSDEEVMNVIRRHMKEMADELGGEMAAKLAEVFSNMPLKEA